MGESFQPFMMVPLGVYPSVNNLAKVVQKCGFYLGIPGASPDSDPMSSLLRRTSVADHPHFVSLVCVTAEELGLVKGVVWLKDVYAEGQKRGLKLCPAEVGLALRKYLCDQNPDVELLVIMEPIVAPLSQTFSASFIYCLTSDENGGPYGKRLVAYAAGDGVNLTHFVRFPRTKFVFVLPDDGTAQQS